MPKIYLNLGCGSNKLKEYINIDIEASCNPDLIHDFTKDVLPYENDSIDGVAMFHTIEHISKSKRPFVLAEIWRVLKPKAKLLMSYPEFLKCVNNWVNNASGQKDFWEATIYGRQLYPSDHHITIIHSQDLKQELYSYGFEEIYAVPEKCETYNTILVAIKGSAITNYEELVHTEISKMVIKAGS